MSSFDYTDASQRQEFKGTPSTNCLVEIYLRHSIRQYFLSLFAIFTLLLCESAYAQHSHGRRRAIEIEHETIPIHDQVLEKAPNDVIIRFNEYLRLIKITLKAEDREMIDIGFQFSTATSRVFIQSVPELAEAAYYTVEWAALNSNNVMVSGFFCFSFGPNAQVPTTIISSRQFPDSPTFGDASVENL